MTELEALIQRYLDETGARQAAVARKMHVSSQTLNSWTARGLKRLPGVDNMRALADAIGVPYGAVLNAILIDLGYLEKSATDNVHRLHRASQAADADRPVIAAARRVTQPRRHDPRAHLQARGEGDEGSQDTGDDEPR